MENEVSGSARPCEDLLSFEVKLKVNYSRGRALPLPDPPQASKPMTPIKPFADFRAEKRRAQASAHTLSQAQGGLFCVLTAFVCCWSSE